MGEKRGQAGRGCEVQLASRRSPRSLLRQRQIPLRHLASEVAFCCPMLASNRVQSSHVMYERLVLVPSDSALCSRTSLSGLQQADDSTADGPPPDEEKPATWIAFLLLLS